MEDLIKKFPLVLLFLFMPAKSQNRIENETIRPRISQADSLLFRAIFCDSIKLDLDIESVIKMSKIIRDDELYVASIGANSVWDPRVGFVDLAFESRRPWVELNPYRFNVPPAKTDNDSISKLSPKKRFMYYARKVFDRLQASEFFKPGNKERTLRLMKEFKEKATTLPSIYGTIDNFFRGDIERFVTELYDKSSFCSEKNFRKLRRTSSKRSCIVGDPVILLMVSKMEYEVLLQWDALLRGEEIEIK